MADMSKRKKRHSPAKIVPKILDDDPILAEGRGVAAVLRYPKLASRGVV